MSKTIILFSTKGGVGKTLLATNIAFGLAKKKRKVLLVDFDLDAVGDICRITDLEPKKGIVDIMYNLKKEKPVNIQDFIINHWVGVDFIPVAVRPHQISHFVPELIKNVFSFFKERYEFIIVDGGKAFSEALVKLFEEANLLLLVVTPDVLSVYQTKWTLDTLQSLYFPLKMVKIILNRAESLASIDFQEISSALPCEIILKVPSEGKVAMLSINKRVPLILEFPRSGIARSLDSFAEMLLSREDLFLEKREVKETELPFIKRDRFLERSTSIEEKAVEEVEEKEDEIILLKQRIHQKLIESLNLRNLDLKTFTNPQRLKELRNKAEGIIADALAEETNSLIASVEVRKKIAKEILDEAFGLGPLEDLIRDPEVTEIMVNNKDQIYVERKGKIELTSKRFISNEQVKIVIDRILAPLGRHVDESNPMVDARLPDGSRVNAIIPPLSLTGPTLTIRKFRKEIFSLEDLIKLGTLTKEIGEFLKACVLGRKNIIISGGTASGKTSLLNVLSLFIPDEERIITIEDAAELKLNQTHWIRLESRPPNIEGKGAVTIRDLFRNSLRMRPDRIIIGECRGAETLDMLQAMNTGHDGSMTTLHANSTQDVLVRLDSLILMSGIELPIRAIREMIASAIDLIVHLQRFPDGSRKVVQVTEVAGMLDEVHVNLKDIFIFKEKGIDSQGRVIGKHLPTGYIPTFFEELRLKGLPISEKIFQKPS